MKNKKNAKDKDWIIERLERAFIYAGHCCCLFLGAIMLVLNLMSLIQSPEAAQSHYSNYDGLLANTGINNGELPEPAIEDMDIVNDSMNSSSYVSTIGAGKNDDPGPGPHKSFTPYGLVGILK